MSAAKNTDSAMAAGVGASLLNKLNLPGAGGAGGNVMASMQSLGKLGGAGAGGYQPKMFGAKPTPSGDGSSDAGGERTFTGRFGAANQVSASIDVPSSQRFLAQSVTGSAQNVLQQRIGGMSGMGTFASANDGASDASSARGSAFATPGARNPQSRKSVLEDADAPNTDEFPPQ